MRAHCKDRSIQRVSGVGGGGGRGGTRPPACQNFGHFHIIWAILRQNFGQFDMIWAIVYKTVSISVKTIFCFWDHLNWDRKSDCFIGQKFGAPQIILSSYAHAKSATPRLNPNDTLMDSEEKYPFTI